VSASHETMVSFFIYFYLVQETQEKKSQPWCFDLANNVKVRLGCTRNWEEWAGRRINYIWGSCGDSRYNLSFSSKAPSKKIKGSLCPHLPRRYTPSIPWSSCQSRTSTSWILSVNATRNLCIIWLKATSLVGHVRLSKWLLFSWQLTPS